MAEKEEDDREVYRYRRVVKSQLNLVAITYCGDLTLESRAALPACQELAPQGHTARRAQGLGNNKHLSLNEEKVSNIPMEDPQRVLRGKVDIYLLSKSNDTNID